MDAQPIRNTGMVLLVIALASLLATFNETFLNVALTPIMVDFGIDANTVQWVATAYMLCAAVMVPLTGFLYKSVPTKRLMAIALCLLLVGTAIGIVAPSFPVLLVARVVQALGTGMLIPLGMNLTLVVAPREKLGTYMGTVSAMTTLGPALGPIVAGVLLGAFTWHALFVFFALLVAVCLVLAIIFIPDASKLTHPRLDALSVVLVGIALVGLLYGISTVFSGQLIAAAVSVVVGVVFLAAFIVRQRKVEEPLLDLRPFANPQFVLGLVLVVMALMTVFSMNMILPVFMQGALGYTALGAALTLLPACVASCVLAPVAGRLYDRWGLRLLAPVGMLLITVFTFFLSHVGVGAASWQIVVLYLLVVIGVSFTMGPSQSFALSRLRPDLHPHGVTIVSTAFQIAGCLGSSLFMGVLSLVQGSRLAEGAATPEAMAGGFQAACLLAAVLGLVGLAVSLLLNGLNRKPKRCKGEDAEAVDAPLDAVMKTEVWSLSEDSTVLDAATLFVERRISAAPIVSSAGEVVGFVSDGDIMRSLAKQTPLFQNAWSILAEQGNDTFDAAVRRTLDTPVMDIATREVIGVEAGDGLEMICKVLADRHLKKAPVFQDGAMVGIVNRSTITRFALETYTGK